nr:hypothetical protein [Gammaproteobacteria bacterium]
MGTADVDRLIDPVPVTQTPHVGGDRHFTLPLAVDLGGLPQRFAPAEAEVEDSRLVQAFQQIALGDAQGAVPPPFGELTDLRDQTVEHRAGGLRGGPLDPPRRPAPRQRWERGVVGGGIEDGESPIKVVPDPPLEVHLAPVLLDLEVGSLPFPELGAEVVLDPAVIVEDLGGPPGGGAATNQLVVADIE